MTDYHSHILPAIDDGAASLDESIEMLKMLREQGVTLVYATPHFDPLVDNPQSFFQKRDKAYEELMLASEGLQLPKVEKGAEVTYFSGISNIKELKSLTLGDSGILLLEMPEVRWSEYVQEELLKLALSTEIRLAIAHIERCMPYQKNGVIDKFMHMGVIFQANCSFFISPKTRRRALSLLKKGKIHILGTDCHNIRNRPPRFNEAIDVIKARYGNTVGINEI